MIKIITATKLHYKYQSDIKTLIKLAYTSSFKPNIITKSLIDEKFEALKYYLANKKCHLLLAKNKEKIVGICHFYIKNEFKENIAHLNQIAVLKEFQGSNFIRIRGGGSC